MRSARAQFWTIIVACTIAYGCGSGLKVSRKDLKPLPPGFSGTFHAQPVHTPHKRRPGPNLLHPFELIATSLDTVQLSITAEGLLTLNYREGGARTEQFMGTFSKRGYFEVYTRKEIKEVPPLVPIIHGRRVVNRIRIALSTDSSLVLDHKWENSGNIFLLAGGGGGRSQNFYLPAD
jgi:hypothetical protein